MYVSEGDKVIPIYSTGYRSDGFDSDGNVSISFKLINESRRERPNNEFY